ncbi:hypothetical protein ATN84_07115 [Paramesorhizobium deserti]|uniref:Uncharacterized protein n=1 Tax=Paramesorhizobium deserti TaxID=1494590 RepID=A0A135HVG7_9HYPH|nr:hypothetical protein ATN84_07115 [Paramesorhizobium deserti]
MDAKTRGIKLLDIFASTTYPIVSAFEYEFLKEEAVVQARMNASTIYFILQRPLIYFDNLVPEDGALSFDIVDGLNAPLQCEVRLSDLGVPNASDCELEILWYRDPETREVPFKEVAGFRLLDVNGKLIVWETPQKLIYEKFANGLPVFIKGDVTPYLNYHVHYIGQAFSQKIWKRLTGHEKLQKILTLEEPLSALTTRPALEISILMLSIGGISDNPLFPYNDAFEPKHGNPILYEFDFDDANDSFERFYNPQLQPGAAELTNEVEALLIHLFKPEYNKKLFRHYPFFKNGARSAGYSDTHLVIEKLPAILSTKHHQQGAVFKSCAPHRLHGYVEIAGAGRAGDGETTCVGRDGGGNARRHAASGAADRFGTGLEGDDGEGRFRT